MGWLKLERKNWGDVIGWLNADPEHYVYANGQQADSFNEFKKQQLTNA